MTNDLSNLPPVGIRALAALIDVDRDTVRSALARSALVPAGKRGGHPVYDLRDALRAMFARRGEADPETLTPIDRRALADARIKELELAKRRGELLPREDVRQAAAEAFQVVAQALRSIPDNLERSAGIDPEQAAAVERVIDGISERLADDLQRLAGE